MKIIDEPVSGVYVIELVEFDDNRGSFLKNFYKSFFQDNKLESNFAESYYSNSKKGVIRGMHFQLPPFDHAKLVCCLNGKIEDVILDIRKNSPSYGQHFSIELSHDNNLMLYIPSGCAHGFMALEDNSLMHYMTTTEYSPDHDTGIAYDSFGKNWKNSSPILSDRDMKLIPFKEFESPFTMND